jgi:hypothetical protein
MRPCAIAHWGLKQRSESRLFYLSLPLLRGKGVQGSPLPGFGVSPIALLFLKKSAMKKQFERARIEKLFLMIRCIVLILAKYKQQHYTQNQ